MSHTPPHSYPLRPGAVIGILGGGQLGRMLSVAAGRLGFQTHIYCPTAASPAMQLAAFSTEAAYEDIARVTDFAKHCDVVTYEFENIPETTAKAAMDIGPLHPGLGALLTAQDRLVEKTFLRDQAHVPVAPFAAINSVEDLTTAVATIGRPSVLKTRRFGYDGKGQVILRDDTDLKDAFKELGGVPCILEGFIPFKRELSIIAARSVTGEFAAYPISENEHQNHILHRSTMPAPNLTNSLTDKAKAYAQNILARLDYVGVIGVEFFDMGPEADEGQLIINEIAPRVHNSGHWTQDAGCIDQFELHIRAIAGWPLGDTQPKFRVEMTNLIGEDSQKWHDYAQTDNHFLHLYGKVDTRPGRKMGHINKIIGAISR